MRKSAIEEVIISANKQGRKALIPFLPAWYPSKERFWAEIAELDAGGADIIEIGIPFSDPVADGPVVEEASLECLERGVSLGKIIAELKEKRSSIRAEIVLMGYYNPFMQYGFASFARDAFEAGVSGVIVPDLPYEESHEFRTVLAEKGIDLVALVGLNTSLKRMQAYARDFRGFVYFVSVLGTTGVRDTLPPELKEGLMRAKEAFSQPIALGFGLSSRAQLDGFGEYAQAGVFGSSLIRHIRSGGSSAGFMKLWQAPA